MQTKPHYIIAFLVTFFLFTVLSLIGCGGGSSSDMNEDETGKLSISELESTIQNELNKQITDVDFTLLVKSGNNRTLIHSTGNSSEFVSYESASTSKLVTSVIILSLIDDDILNLTDNPQDYIDFWPTSGLIADITLHQLLNFTSGLTASPLCLNSVLFDFEACVERIAINNAEPSAAGTEFYYSGTHLQVAGLMAIKAAGYNSWQEVFSAFKAETSLFANSTYELPSANNPRLAGGMRWTAGDYINFLEALFTQKILSPELFNEMRRDQIEDALIGYSPALENLNEDWHYGYGVWIECMNNPNNCDLVTRISSPGAFGAYPFIDFEHGYYGIIARQGELGTMQDGVNLYKSIQSMLEDWASR